jgi:hypothetical protein
VAIVCWLWQFCSSVEAFFVFSHKKIHTNKKRLSMSIINKVKKLVSQMPFHSKWSYNFKPTFSNINAPHYKLWSFSCLGAVLNSDLTILSQLLNLNAPYHKLWSFHCMGAVWNSDLTILSQLLNLNAPHHKLWSFHCMGALSNSDFIILSQPLNLNAPHHNCDRKRCFDSRHK